MEIFKMFNEAGATLGRIIQQAEEVFLDVPRTEYSEEYKNNIKKVDFLIALTQKSFTDAEVFLEPSTVYNLEGKTIDNVLEASEKKTPLEDYGRALQASFPTTKIYSPQLDQDLSKIGKYQKRLGLSLKSFQIKATENFVMKLKKMYDIDLKKFKDYEESLELVRLDHDYMRNRRDNAYTSAGRDAMEKEYEKLKPAFDRQYEETKEFFRTINNYFTKHRQLLKDFVTIQRDYYRECDKNLTRLLRKLYSENEGIDLSGDITPRDHYDSGILSTKDISEAHPVRTIIEKENETFPELNNSDSLKGADVNLNGSLTLNGMDITDNLHVGFDNNLDEIVLEKPIAPNEEVVEVEMNTKFEASAPELFETDKLNGTDINLHGSLELGDITHGGNINFGIESNIDGSAPEKPSLDISLVGDLDLNLNSNISIKDEEIPLTLDDKVSETLGTHDDWSLERPNLDNSADITLENLDSLDPFDHKSLDVSLPSLGGDVKIEPGSISLTGTGQVELNIDTPVEKDDTILGGALNTNIEVDLPHTENDPVSFSTIVPNESEPLVIEPPSDKVETEIPLEPSDISLTASLGGADLNIGDNNPTNNDQISTGLLNASVDIQPPSVQLSGNIETKISDEPERKPKDDDNSLSTGILGAENKDSTGIDIEANINFGNKEENVQPKPEGQYKFGFRNPKFDYQQLE